MIAILSIGLGIFVLFRSSDRRVGRMFCLFAFSVGMWGVGIVWISIAQTISMALSAWRTTYALGVIWIAPLLFQFVCAFLDLKKSRAVLVNHVVGLFFLSLLFTPLFFRRADFLFGQFFYIRGGPLYNIFLLWWIGVVSVAHVYLIRSLKTVDPAKRTQIQYFLLATVVGFISGFHTYLPKIGIDVYPWGAYGVALYPIIMAYAILRFHLLDIRIFIRRIALFLGLYVALLLIGGVIVSLLHVHRLGSTSQMTGTVTVEALNLVLTLSVGPFLYAYLVRRGSYFHEHEMAGLTHELKSPLANIQSAMDFLQDIKEGDRFRPAHADYMDMINRNTARLERAVNELIKVFRLPAGSEPFKFEVVDLRKILSGAVSANEERAQEKGLEIHLSVPDQEIPIKIDSEKIQQAVSNLLSNAIKYTPSGSITLKVEEQKDSIEVSVTDTGAGILSDELPLVFDRFFQGKAGKGAKGSGIGLTIAKTWVEAHGGEIHAESAGLGRGSRFWFTLPRN